MIKKWKKTHRQRISKKILQGKLAKLCFEVNKEQLLKMKNLSKSLNITVPELFKISLENLISSYKRRKINGN